MLDDLVVVSLANHIFTDVHAVCTDLQTDVSQEGITLPTSLLHDKAIWFVVEEHEHCE